MRLTISSCELEGASVQSLCKFGYIFWSDQNRDTEPVEHTVLQNQNLLTIQDCNVRVDTLRHLFFVPVLRKCKLLL